MNNRDTSLDFVKGFLVIVMVMYHTISYFTTAGYAGTQYVRFGNGAFIFISGYIVSVFYQRKFELDKIRVCKRLAARGLKLLLIFTFINVMINLFGIHSLKSIQYDIDLYFIDIYSIYITGDSTYSVFKIIVPIAYLLLLSPIILFFKSWRKTIIIATSILLSAYVIFRIDLFNLYGLLIGLVGLSFGLLGGDHDKFSIKLKTIIIILFCITVSMMKYFDRNIMSYSLGIIIILKLVYDFSKTQNLTEPFNKLIIMLGQYSLLSYLIQIAFLQLLYQLVVKQKFDLGYEAFVIVVITNTFLIAVFLLLETLRDKFRVIDKSYKLIFS